MTIFPVPCIYIHAVICDIYHLMYYVLTTNHGQQRPMHHQHTQMTDDVTTGRKDFIFKRINPGVLGKM